MKWKIFFYTFLMTVVGCKKLAEINVNPRKINTETESKFLNLDSIQLTNEKKIEVAEKDVNKLIVSKRDSLIWNTNSKYLEHRIFGYEKPNINSRKLILISCFTADVENNPFELPLGAYYDLDKDHKAKFLKIEKEFIEAKFILNGKDMEKVYFENKWVEFDND